MRFRQPLSLIVVLVLLSPSLGNAQSLEDRAAQRRAARMGTTATVTPQPSSQPAAPARAVTIISEEDQRIDAVARAEDAVASVVVSRTVDGREQLVSGGSAFFVSPDGDLLTNYHVVDDDDGIYTILMNNGDEARARVVATDTAHDIALLHVDRSGTTYLSLAKPGDVRLAQTAIAMGNALGEYGNTVSVGIISALRRAVHAKGSGGFSEHLTGLLQTDASINAGTSGGPLLNLRGEVIGMIVARDTEGAGIGFAIPADRLREFLKSHLRSAR